jgi:hypothetical protein
VEVVRGPTEAGDSEMKRPPAEGLDLVETGLEVALHESANLSSAQKFKLRNYLARGRFFVENQQS